MLGFNEVEVLWRHRHGFPVEAAFEQQGASGIRRALEADFEFLFEAIVLLGGEVAVAGGIDERAGWSRGVIQQRLVPAGGGVVDIDGGRCGFDRAETVVIVERVEQFLVEHAA